MPFQQLLTMRPALLTGKALRMQLAVVGRRSWQQSGSDWLRWCRFPIRFSRYLVMIMFGVLLVSRRMRIVVSSYCWFRIVDDILDGDREPPAGFSSATYRKRIDVLMAHLDDLQHCPVAPLPEDIHLVHIVSTCRQKRVDIRREMRGLWSVMSWDFDRRHAPLPPRALSLQHYATLQDRVILSGCIKLLGGDVRRIDALEVLTHGVFTRIDWVVDVARDLQAGVVNIPREATQRYGIDLSAARLAAAESEQRLRSIPGIRQWRADELAGLRRQWQDVRRPLVEVLIRSFRSRFRAMVLHRPLVRTFEWTLHRASN